MTTAGNQSYQEMKKNKYFLKILEQKLAFIIAVPILALLLTLLIFHLYRVDGTSMTNTFGNRDLLLVNKLGKTTASVFGKDYVPKRYEVIVFKEPNYNPDEELVKRVIGLPGDRVVIKNNKVTIYDKQYPTGLDVDSHVPARTEIIEGGYVDADIRVEKGQVFVLGDNRPGSDDSRLYGPIETKNIVGDVVARLLPLKNFWIF